MKLRTQYVLLLYFLCIISSSNAQKKQNLDSLLQVYKELPDDTLKVGVLGKLFSMTLYSDFDQSKKYAYARLKLAQQIQYYKGIADGNYNVGTYNMNNGHGDSAKIYYRNALKLYTKLKNTRGQFNTRHALAVQEKYEGNYDEAIKLTSANLQDRLSAGDSVGLAGTHLGMAQAYEKKGSYKIAYDHILAALAIYDKIDQPLWKADALFALASLEIIFKNFRKAIVYAKDALEIYKEHGEKVYQLVTQNGIGQFYIDLKEYEVSLEYLTASLDLSRELKMTELEGIVIRNLGRAQMGLNRPTQGITYLKESVDLLKTANRPDELFHSLASIGRAYNSISRPNEGLPYFTKAIELLESKRPTANGASVYEGRSQAWELNKAYNLALQDYKEFKVLNDSIFNSDKTKQIEELRTIYDTEKKEQEIALQKNEIALLEEKEKNTALQRTLLIAGLLTSFILFGLIYYGIHQKLRRNKLKKEQVDSELAFKNKELITHALHLARKNETLESLKKKAEELKSAENGQGITQLISTINFDLQDDNNWNNFSKYFEQVHIDFNSKIKSRFPEVTSNELRLMALLKMNLSSKEIANILNVSQEGVRKAYYRLRKKLNLTSDESLRDLVLSL